MGRNSQNKVVIFPKRGHGLGKGDYAWVKIGSCTQATLKGELTTEFAMKREGAKISQGIARLHEAGLVKLE